MMFLIALILAPGAYLEHSYILGHLAVRTYEELKCKNRQLHFFVFEKNEIKALNLLGNALENFHIFTHKMLIYNSLYGEYPGIANSKYLDLAFVCFCIWCFFCMSVLFGILLII
jgi:hypothetical protein